MSVPTAAPRATSRLTATSRDTTQFMSFRVNADTGGQGAVLAGCFCFPGALGSRALNLETASLGAGMSLCLGVLSAANTRVQPGPQLGKAFQASHLVELCLSSAQDLVGIQ